MGFNMFGVWGAVGKLCGICVVTRGVSVDNLSWHFIEGIDIESPMVKSSRIFAWYQILISFIMANNNLVYCYVYVGYHLG